MDPTGATPHWRSRRRHQRKVHRENRFSDDPVERLVGRVDFRARSISEIRASLTASSFGNTFATSGLRTMIFDSSFKRFEYLPRTRPPGKSDRLYSGRSSSLSFFLSFFIEFSFSFACVASGNDSNVFALFGVRYHQKPTSFRNAKGNKPFFRCPEC